MNTQLIPKRVLLFLIASQTVFLLCTFLFVTGIVSFGFNGFGVDSSGKIYVGIGHKIEVFEDGKKILTIKKGTSRGYCFTIQKDDTILLAGGEDVFIFDLCGKHTIAQWKDPSIEDHLEENMYSFVTSGGDVYSATSPMGRLTIYHDEKPIYKMPLQDYVGTILFFISIPFFVISVYLEKKHLRKWFERPSIT